MTNLAPSTFGQFPFQKSPHLEMCNLHTSMGSCSDILTFVSLRYTVCTAGGLHILGLMGQWNLCYISPVSMCHLPIKKPILFLSIEDRIWMFDFASIWWWWWNPGYVVPHKETTCASSVRTRMSTLSRHVVHMPLSSVETVWYCLIQHHAFSLASRPLLSVWCHHWLCSYRPFT